MCAGPQATSVMTHGLSTEQADTILRNAYTARSAIIMPPVGSA
jgi:hypothetical protein